MLLTSGQVSVAISSFVVFLFTSALFLSGYVLQQQTVRDLRAAIKPKPTSSAARLYLPTQFAVQPTPSPKAEENGDLERVGAELQDPGVVNGMVEVKETSNDILNNGSGQTEDVVSEETTERRKTQENRPTQDDIGSVDMIKEQVSMAVEDEQLPNEPDLLDNASLIPAGDDKPKAEKPLSRAERRKKIKEEIMAAGDGEGFKGYKRRQW